MKENVNLDVRGILTIEAYNKEGVFFSKTKKNLVVETANEIMAQALANPNKRTEAVLKEELKTSNTPVVGSGYPVQLGKTFAKRVKGEMVFSDLNVETIKVEQQLANLLNVKSMFLASTDEDEESTELVEGVDFFVKDEDTGMIEFAVAPTSNVLYEASVKNKKGQKLKKGTLSIEADFEVYKVAAEASDTNKTVKVDYDLGEVYFETPKVNVSVEYTVTIPYGINFMALGGVPSPTWQKGRPVEFANSDKLKLAMDNEIPQTRVLIDFPEFISQSAPEIDLGIKTQPMAKTTLVDNLTIVPKTDDPSNKELVYKLNNLFDEGEGASPRILERVLTVKNVTKSDTPITNFSIAKNTITGIEIKFEDADVDVNDVVEVRYELRLSNAHLIYKLGQSPVLKLLSVRHINSLDSTDIREYKIVKNGLEQGSGDVWISNSNTGHITFSSTPVGVNPASPAPKVETPGTLQVEYLVNSGSAVQFTADFPAGTPGMTIEEAVHSLTLTPGVSQVVIPSDLHIDSNGDPAIVSIEADGLALQSHDYTVEPDNHTVSLNASSAGQVIIIKYKKEVTSQEVYQVAMFDEQTGGKMFNISGLGPIPKDKDTGIRVAWTIVF